MKRTSLVLSATMLVTGLSAQKYDFTSTWDHDLAPLQATMGPDSARVAAQRISIHEADDGQVADLWKKLMKERGATVERSGNNSVVQGLEMGGPVTVRTTAERNKKSGSTDLLLAMSGADGKPLEEARAASVAKDLAVQLNKAVVQAQVDEVQKDLDKAEKDLKGTEKDRVNAASEAEDRREDLDQGQKKVGRSLEEVEELQRDLEKLQKKYKRSQDAKVLEEIADKQKDLAKAMDKQSDLTDDQQKAGRKLEKATDEVPDAAKDVEKVQQETEKLAAFLAAMQVKLASIH
ncbi:MAG: hypothetical protein ABI599_06195 [Flavobacteriales bacterium]